MRVVRCSSRDALETADASRLVRARFREGRNRRRIESAATTRGGKLRERERERVWYGSWQCQCLRRCTEALSENGRRLSVFRLYRKNGFVSRVRRTSRSLRGLPQWTSINFQAFPVALRLLSFLSLSPLPPSSLPSFRRGSVNSSLSLLAGTIDRSIYLSIQWIDAIRFSFLSKQALNDNLSRFRFQLKEKEFSHGIVTYYEIGLSHL